MKNVVFVLSMLAFLATTSFSVLSFSADMKITVPATSCHEYTTETHSFYRSYAGAIHNMEATYSDNYSVVCPVPYVVSGAEEGDLLAPDIYVYDSVNNSSVGVDCTVYTYNYSGSQIDYDYASTDTAGTYADYVGWISMSYSFDPAAWEFSYLDLNGGNEGDRIMVYCNLPGKDGTTYGSGIGAISARITYL